MLVMVIVAGRRWVRDGDVAAAGQFQDRRGWIARAVVVAADLGEIAADGRDTDGFGVT